MNTVRLLLRRLLEPAPNPLSDSLGLSLGRLIALRASLKKQLDELRRRSGSLVQPRLEAQIHKLEEQYLELGSMERKVTRELDIHRTQCDLLSARQTAAEAQERMEELIGALDEAHARAAALAESVLDEDL